LIDVINRFDFRGAAPLIRAAGIAAPKIASLARAARTAGVPVIYVNDNFGRWSSDFKSTIAECTRAKPPVPAIVKRLKPVRGDYFVLKPQHSGFYATPLELLLGHLGVHTLVLTGYAANICVLFTADDAHMRGYHLVVPRDCVASNSRALTRFALDHVEVTLHGDTTPASEVDFDAFRDRQRKPRGQTF
jgi:nicotinamidase-related amidase